MIRNFVDGDIVTSRYHFLTGKAATANGVMHRLKMFLGEFFLDVSDGTPWFQSILGKSPQDEAEISLKQRILTHPNVVGITDFKFTSDSSIRSITVEASIVDVNNQSVELLLNEDIV